MNQKGAVHRIAQCVLSQGEGCETHANKAEFPASSLRRRMWHNQQKPFAVNCKFRMFLQAGTYLWILHEVEQAASLSVPALGAPLAKCKCSTALLLGSFVHESNGPAQQVWMWARIPAGVLGHGRAGLPAQWCMFFWLSPGLIQQSLFFSIMVALCTEDSKALSFKGPFRKSRISSSLVPSGLCLWVFHAYQRHRFTLEFQGILSLSAAHN